MRTAWPIAPRAVAISPATAWYSMPTRRCGLAPSTAAVAPTPRYSDAIGARLPGLEALLNISVGSWRLSLFIDAEGGFFTGRDAWFRVRFRLKAGRRATAR